MVELPTVYIVEVTEELQTGIDMVCEQLTDEQHLQSADGGLVAERVSEDIAGCIEDGSSELEISQGAVQHLMWAIETISQTTRADEAVLTEAWEQLKDSKQKEWSDEDKEEFQEALLGGL